MPLKGPNPRASHQPAFQGKDAGGAQPVRVLLRYVDDHARLAVLAEFDAPDAPYREA